MKSINEFKSIASDAELFAFIKQHNFIEDVRPTPPQILGVYEGQIEGINASITHRWYDPSGPFQNEPDIHKAKLKVDGVGSHEVAYKG